MTEKELALQKAHSAAKHLQRMAKAASSFKNTMHKVVDAHHDDMQSAIGNMAKVMGVEESFKDGGGDIDLPTHTDITNEGTGNLIDFGKANEVRDLLKALEEKGYKVTAPEVPELVSKTEVAELIRKTQEDTLLTLLKALTGKTDDASLVIEAPMAKAAPAVGVGDRQQVQEPVRRVTEDTLLTKGMPNLQQPEVTTLKPGSSQSEDLVRRAVAGDTLAQLDLMKGARPTGLPNTLTEAMSKVH